MSRRATPSPPSNYPRPTDNPIKQGYLTKQGGSRGGLRNWKKRWIALKSDCLYYYRSKPNNTSNPNSYDHQRTHSSGTGSDVDSLGASSEEYSPADSSRTSLLLGMTLLKNAKIIDVAEQRISTLAVIKAPKLDSNGQVCGECKRFFGVLLRRDNCRNCGKAFCKNHLPFKMEIQKYDYFKPVPVCEECSLVLFEELKAVEKANAGQNQGVIAVEENESDEEQMPIVERVRNVGQFPISSRSSLFGVRRFLFAIVSPDRELWLSADDENEKQNWIDAISKEIQNSRKVQRIRGLINQHQEWEINFEEIRILKKLGHGAFGEVSLGKLWGTEIAVKMLISEEVTEDTVSVLKKEIGILSALRHPNVVLYIGACTKPPNVCIVTESCERGSLYSVLHDPYVLLNFQRTIEIAVGIAQGMNYLHSQAKPIMHRDLKSSNILLDKNYCVKVADFGLSHVRKNQKKKKILSKKSSDYDDSGIFFKLELAHKDLKESEEELGGHYGVLGTPEWMAPEMLEGLAYNHKVDVYSYGIILAELLTREIPYHDLGLNSYHQIVEAVLEEDLRPTVPDWCGISMKRLIEDCVQREPSKRPSFMAILSRLRKFFSMNDEHSFRNFDVPRLMWLLDSDSPSRQIRGAWEIAELYFSNRFSKGFEHADSFFPVDFPTKLKVFSKLSTLLFSNNSEVLLQTCRALNAFLSSSTKNEPVIFRKRILESRGIENLLGILQNDNENLKAFALNVLSELSPDLESNFHILRGMSKYETRRIEILMLKELKKASLRLQSEHENFSRKVVFRELFKKISSAEKNDGAEKKLVDHIATLSREYSDLTRILGNSGESVPIAFLRTSDSNSIVLRSQLYLGFPAPELSVIANEPEKSSLIEILPDAVLYNNVLMLESIDENWDHVLLAMSEDIIQCYKLYRNEQPKLIKTFKRSSISIHHKASFRYGRHHLKPYCLFIGDGLSESWFCFKSIDTLSVWISQISGEEIRIPQNPNCDYVIEQLRSLARVTVLPEQFSDYFGELSIWKFGSLLLKDSQLNIWSPVFALFLNGKELKIYESLHSSPEDAFRSIEISISDSNVESWQESDEKSCFLIRVNSGISKEKKETFEFCLSDAEDRESWIDFLLRNPPRLKSVHSIEMPSILKLLFDEATHSSQLHNELLEENENIELKENLFDFQVNDIMEHEDSNFDSSFVSPKLIAHFGICSKHGYLMKRGRIRKSWKRRYFYLIGSELHYFPSHLSRPNELLGTIHLSTRSGESFKVTPLQVGSRKYCFTIESPGRTWFLQSLNEKEMSGWLEAIRESTRQIVRKSVLPKK